MDWTTMIRFDRWRPSELLVALRYVFKAYRMRSEMTMSIWEMHPNKRR
jgi:hypothetical protein